MATGTGKTYTAFQIIYRLWKSGLKKRILFLADRTALIDQTVRGDFRHFKEAMTVIKHKQIDTAYNIYLALYQGLSDNNDDDDAYKQFSPEFFDLVIVDECHRGSAREDSKWREILEYFKGATHIGLTATPKETKEISSTEYFGDPLYTYSLKQGIDDGFLAPYKVIKVTLDIDAEGWRPPKGFKDKDGKARRRPHLQPHRLRQAPRRRGAPPARGAENHRVPQRRATASPRPSSSAWTSNTPRGCARNWRTPTPTSSPPTANT